MDCWPCFFFLGGGGGGGWGLPTLNRIYNTWSKIQFVKGQSHTPTLTLTQTKRGLKESLGTIIYELNLRIMRPNRMTWFYILFNSVSVISGRWDVDNERLCANWSFLCGWEDFVASGDRTQSARSVGQRLTHWATRPPNVWTELK